MYDNSKLKYLDFEALSRDFVPDKNPGGSHTLEEYIDFLIEFETIRPPVIDDFSKVFQHWDFDKGEYIDVEVFYSGSPIMERVIGHEMDNIWFYPRKPGQDGLGVP